MKLSAALTLPHYKPRNASLNEVIWLKSLTFRPSGFIKHIFLMIYTDNKKTLFIEKTLDICASKC